MALYETLFIVHPEKGGRVKEFIDRFRKIIESQEGTVTDVDEWGLRELAYRIQKQNRGYYALLRYRSSGRGVEELERNLKLTDGILRYLTVRAEEGSPTRGVSPPKSREEEGGKTGGEPGPGKAEAPA
ncbi:MAG TPA: 30S ribosomal protein S6 [candidate division Zixibacteria bacterium]|nr:30S ribosomal protein S6 [candidate division Zixibacteria bacterium]